MWPWKKKSKPHVVRISATEALAKFKENFPEDIEGYTIGALRINDISGVIAGFVLINPKGGEALYSVCW